MLQQCWHKYLVLLALLFSLIALSAGSDNPLNASSNSNINSLKESSLEEAIQIATAKKCPVTTYFQEHFERVLIRDGIQHRDLVRSLMDCDHKIPTGGKSGSSFIITRDKHFVLKTISKDEFETFQELSAHYFDYLEKFPETLLVPFYGLYKMQGLSPHYIVMMPNLVPRKTDKTQLFDLKGRAKKPNHSNPHMIDDNTFPEPPPFAITNLKHNQIVRDLEFLRVEGLMDYSLFINKQDGELEGLYLIDYLTRYNWKKRISHFFKQSVWNEQQISTINPDKYARRIGLLVDHCSDRF